VKLGTNLGYRFYAHNLSRFYNCDWIIGRAPAGLPVTAPRPSAAVSDHEGWPRSAETSRREKVEAA
jgi:hypothetical protein